MSDLASPLVAVLQEEIDAFWCFQARSRAPAAPAPAPASRPPSPIPTFQLLLGCSRAAILMLLPPPQQQQPPPRAVRRRVLTPRFCRASACARGARAVGGAQRLMEQVGPNFHKDQNGMHAQLQSLHRICKVAAPVAASRPPPPPRARPRMLRVTPLRRAGRAEGRECGWAARGCAGLLAWGGFFFVCGGLGLRWEAAGARAARAKR